MTKRPPTSQELESTMLFAWKVAKHVKSNAIVFAREGRTRGDRRGADEPRGFGENRGDEGAGITEREA